MVPFTKTVQALPATVPFVGPEAMERARGGRVFEARIGANESAFGLSPAAAAAMRDEVGRASWYGDPESHDLRAALSEIHGESMDRIVVGGGIDELLGVLVRTIVSPGVPVVTSHGAYPTFNFHVAGSGGLLHAVPYRDDREDLDGLLTRVRETGAPLVYLSNPDNPMGTWREAGAVAAFIDALPAGTVLVLDEAYVEFAPEPVAPRVDFAKPNVVRMRTFSKAHGMAGARIGYAVAHRDLIAGFHKIRNHFGVNRIGQAGALASLADEAFVEAVRVQVDEGRREYYALAERLGLSVIPSATNFVAIDVGGGERARAVLRTLVGEDVFIRMPGVAPLDRCVRVTVGTPRDRAVFAEAFERAIATTDGESPVGGS